MKGEHDDDVRAIDEELRDGAHTRGLERVVARSRLDVWRRPVDAPVAVAVQVAFLVLVQLAVVVVVDPLVAEERPLPLLAGLDAHHQPRVLGVRLPLSERIAPAHLRDVAVAVEVVRAILVHQPVAVVVSRDADRAARARRVGVVEEVVAAVHVDRGNHVERVAVHELGHLLVVAVEREQAIEQRQADLRRLDFVAVDVAVDVDARLVERRAGLRVVHGHGPDVAAFLALADRFDLGQLGEGGVQGAERLADLLVGVVVVEAEGNGDFVSRDAELRVCGLRLLRRLRRDSRLPVQIGAETASAARQAVIRIRGSSLGTSLPGIESQSSRVSLQAFAESSARSMAPAARRLDEPLQLHAAARLDVVDGRSLAPRQERHALPVQRRARRAQRGGSSCPSRSGTAGCRHSRPTPSPRRCRRLSPRTRVWADLQARQLLGELQRPTAPVPRGAP